MTDIKTRSKLPFTVISSSVTTGYQENLINAVGQNIDIVNTHRDDYGELESSPAQGPFTNQHVGGNQHRHIKLNDGTDDSTNRPEAYVISASTNSVKVYGPDINGVSSPRATKTRGLIAKSPVNINNIQTSGNIAGNFEHNYQVVQSVGRRTTNNLINDNFIASGVLTTKFVTGSEIYSLPEIDNNSKSIFVERFSAPGGKEETSRGALDREGEEYAPNNSLTTRNIKVRQPLYSQLTQHAAQFNSGTVEGITIHGVHRNTLRTMQLAGTTYVSGAEYDNFWVQHAIPRSDINYAWITASSTTNPHELGGYQSYDGEYDRNGAFTDISFALTSSFGDHLGITGAIDKDEAYVSELTNTFYRTRKYLQWINGTFGEGDVYFQNLQLDISNIAPEINERDFTISFWIKFPNLQNTPSFDIDNPYVSDLGAMLTYNLLEYGDNTLQLILTSTSNLIVNPNVRYFNVNSATKTSQNILAYPKIDDNKWHLITITSDVNTSVRRVRTISGTTRRAVNSTVTKVYVDAGLVYTCKQDYVKLPVDSLIIPDTGYQKAIEEIYVWNKVLTEKEILQSYRESATKYGERPLKYIQHKFNNKIPIPIHAYSSDIDDSTTDIYVSDKQGNKDAILINYIQSFNLKPSINNGVISYSTYGNGPYQGANWKFIRNNEHIVTRKLTTENTNYVSVIIPEKERTIKRTIKGQNVTINLPPPRKAGTVLNVKEPPVYINKPLKHSFIFKGSNNNQGYTITHTYWNNIQYFANDTLNNALKPDLMDKSSEQLYNKLYTFYADTKADESENPIEKFLGYTVNETIFPKSSDAFLKDNRARQDYITDEPGYNLDGYDRQLGTQRTFWRDNQEDRQRTNNSYIDSLGHQVNSGLNPARSVTVLDETKDSIKTGSITQFSVGSVFFGYTEYRKYALYDLLSSGSGELNNLQYITLSRKADRDINVLGTPGVIDLYQLMAVHTSHQQIPELYYSNDGTNYRQYSTTDLYPFYTPLHGVNKINFIPSYCYNHSECYNINVYFDVNEFSSSIKQNTTFDLGINRYTEKISGKNPWFENYDNYLEDIRGVGKKHSKLSEFKISDFMKDTIKINGGNFRKISFKDYTKDIKLNIKDKLEKENKEFVKQDKIKININGIKKLLPYNGFYPQDRSIQLVNNLKDSYLDSGAVKGGLFLSGGYNRSTHLYNNITESYYATSENTLENILKESSFLEPLYAPGIFYNTIKSGLAVDWSVYTGSLPNSGTLTIANGTVVTLASSPSYKLPFETILDPFIGFPVSSSENVLQNRVIKNKDIDLYFTAVDYGHTDTNDIFSFQGFCELEKKSNPIYSLSVNNFFAESINFFLKDSKLNSFVSKPDEEFKTMNSSKTYYMDVVLRKTENFKMIDAHSSSVGENYGKMSGRYFGPSFFTSSDNIEIASIQSGIDFYKTKLDPSYCIYTPPYFYGDSIARISFKPSTTRKYTLEEIFADASIEYLNLGLRNASKYPSGSNYEPLAMGVDASVTLFGQLVEKKVDFEINAGNSPALRNSDNFSRLLGNPTSIRGDAYAKKWVVSTKMESPTLDFSEQEHIIDTNFLNVSDGFVTASGYGIGMWSGYGQIPTGSEGIFFEIRESFPNNLNRLRRNNTTGSLIDVCGFTPQVRRVGEIADSKIISEAVLIVPYSINKKRGTTIKQDNNNILVNDTTTIEDVEFYKINKDVYRKQKSNIESGKPAVVQGDFGSTIEIQKTSISNMIEMMNKYVIPPNMNFLEYPDIDPFVMYFAEFKSILDKQDLADIWQGVMPKPAMKAEIEDVTVSQNNTLHDFFHGEGLPENVRFMVFKLKRKAEINYYKMTADSTDDDRFRFDFQVGKKAPEYSFNWPYDYFSLVELAKIDLEIDYVHKDEDE